MQYIHMMKYLHTHVIPTHTYTYMHIHAYTCLYLYIPAMHAHTCNGPTCEKTGKNDLGRHTCEKMRSNTHTGIYVHIHAHTCNTCRYMQIHADTCTYMQIHAHSIIHADKSKYTHIHAHTCNTPKHQTWNGHVSATNQLIETSQKTEQITVSTRQIVLGCGTIDSFPRIWRHLKNRSRGSSLAHQNPKKKQPISARADASCTTWMHVGGG